MQAKYSKGGPKGMREGIVSIAKIVAPVTQLKMLLTYAM